MKSRTSVKIGEFLFHATDRKVGSDPDGIRKPSLKRLFFVADSMEIALEYVSLKDYKSIYVDDLGKVLSRRLAKLILDLQKAEKASGNDLMMSETGNGRS